MLGIPERYLHVLTKKGDKGTETGEDGKVHPKAAQIANARQDTLTSICDKLLAFEGQQIDLYLFAPGHGNIGAIVSRLQFLGKWPLEAKWKVILYTGSYNMRGMDQADINAIAQVVSCSNYPLVDISRFPFFGGSGALPETTGLGTFVLPSFAASVQHIAPHLAA